MGDTGHLVDDVLRRPILELDIPVDIYIDKGECLYGGGEHCSEYNSTMGLIYTRSSAVAVIADRGQRYRPGDASYRPIYDIGDRSFCSRGHPNTERHIPDFVTAAPIQTDHSVLH